jgi:hypothetical protein
VVRASHRQRKGCRRLSARLSCWVLPFICFSLGVDPDSALLRPPRPPPDPQHAMPPVTTQPMAMEQTALGCSAPHRPVHRPPPVAGHTPGARLCAATRLTLPIRQKVLPGLFFPIHISRLPPGSFSTAYTTTPRSFANTARQRLPDPDITAPSSSPANSEADADGLLQRARL